MLNSAISPVIYRICCIAGWSLELATIPDKIMQTNELAGFDEGQGIGRFCWGRLMLALNKVLKYVYFDHRNSNAFFLHLMFLVHCYLPNLSLKILSTITHAQKLVPLAEYENGI